MINNCMDNNENLNKLTQAVELFRIAITNIAQNTNEFKNNLDLKISSSLEFMPDNSGIYGKGILWKDGQTKQFVYRANPDRIWTTEIIDLNSESYYSINNIPVLRLNELGSSVKKSYLNEVGTLQNLSTQGNLNVDNYLTYSSSTKRIGIGTDTPNSKFSIASLHNEFIVDIKDHNTRVGNWTNHDLEIVTDNTCRIFVDKNGNITLGTNSNSKTTINGSLGINIKNPDVDISTSGPVRFEGKKFEVGDNIPSYGSYNKGDIVWNTDPKPTGYVGWICVRDGTPGEWRPFGQIFQ